MRRTVAAVCLLLAAGAAGCLFDGGDGGGIPPPTDGDGGGDGGGPDGDEPASYSTPKLASGYWWSYELERDGETRRVTLAVQSQSDGRYQVLANDTDLAVRDALEGLAWVGPVRVDDLAGIEDGEAVRLYEWPLEDGRTWSTDWNGATREMTAETGPIPIADGSTPGVRIASRTAEAGGNGTYAEYTYAPGVAYLVSLESPAGGTWTVRNAGFSYGGNLTAAQAETVLEAASPAKEVSTFEVGEDAARVAASLEGGGASASYDVTLVDPNGTRHQIGPDSCQDCTVDVAETVPAVAGTWGLDASLASQPMGNLTLEVSVVQVEERAVSSG